MISAARVAFFWVVNATRNEKSCLQFLIPTAVFHILLTQAVFKSSNGETFVRITYTVTCMLQNCAMRIAHSYYFYVHRFGNRSFTVIILIAYRQMF